MYPNPLKGSDLNISVQAESMISIFNILGELVYQTQLMVGENQLNLEYFSTGVYLVRIDNSFGITTKKLIKQ